MYKIKTYNKIAPAGLSQFPSELYDVSPDIQQPDAIILRSQSLHDVELAESLQVIGRAGAGVNNIPVDKMTELGIPVLNTPGANANAVCELVLAGMLLASRNICEAWQFASQLSGDDEAINKQVEGAKKQFVGTELLGKTLGVIGLGSIGAKVANAALHLGMQVIGYDPTISVSRAWELSANVVKANNMQELIRNADFVTVHVPLVDATRNMVDADCIRALKRSAYLLNFARDGVVDQASLVAALKENRIKGYVSDFPCADLIGLPNAISLPHLGASTLEAEENCAVRIVKQVKAFLEYGAINYSVNFPQAEASPQFDGVRLAVVNANVPNMVSQMSAKLSEVGLNITELLNKSRDAIAYTIIDVQGEVSDKLLQEFAQIDGVLKVRKLVSAANY